MMRIYTPPSAALTTVCKHQLTFTGGRGERFDVFILDHDLIRVRHWPDGQPRLDRTWLITAGADDVPLAGRSRDDLSGFALPTWQHTADGDHVTVQTDALRLRIDTRDFHLRWETAKGQPFASDLPRRAYPYDRAGRTVFHYMRRERHEHFYGLGESAGCLDKHGAHVRLRSVDALGYNAETSTPLYKHIPFLITYEPRANVFYGLLYDNASSATFDLGREVDAFWGFYRYYQADDGDIDYYLIYGPTLPQVLARLAWLTGRPALPPRWTLGYLGSTMSYTEAPDAQEQLKRFVDLCEQHDIPCDLFHLSSGYTTGADGQRYVFTWNRAKVPDPAAMVQRFHEAGVHLAANVKPYLLTSHPDYPELAASGGLIQDADEDAPALSTFWSGGAFEAGQGGYVDFTHPCGYAWWQRRAREQLLAYGIDALWNDNNEFEIWDDAARCAGFGRPIPIGQARPLQTLLMGRASYEALQAHAPRLRPYVLTRSGAAGIQRYAQTWSGDNETSWHTLRFNIPMGLSLSLSGVPNTGHDVGGFYGPAPDPELFVRWMQCGIFHPRFTIHSWNTDGTVNEPWMYPEALPLIRALMRFRYRLIPYLYSLLYHAHQTGQPIIRPLLYHFPEDAACRTTSFEFMLGSELLIAPVLEPAARQRTVYLPRGAGWVDYHTGAYYDGGQTVTLNAPLERAPLLMIEGGMLPLGPVMRHVGAAPDDAREVICFPHRAEGERTLALVEDDGETVAYREGAVTVVTLKQQSTPAAITLSATAHGGYPLPYDHVTFILPASEPRPLHGAARVWRDAQGRRCAAVTIHHGLG